MAISQNTTTTRPLVTKAGNQYGHLTVLREVDPVVVTIRASGRPSGFRRFTKRMILCRCACGREIVKWYLPVMNGDTRSCGCRKGELSAATRNGELGRVHCHPEYAVWVSMKSRCYNQNELGYSNYGGRGIGVCVRWRESFSAFLEDMGNRPTPRHSLDRIDPNGNYEPGNCRWATAAIQGRNKTNNRVLTVDGVSLSISDWAALTGTPQANIGQRISRSGWSVEDAVLVKPRHQNSRSVEGAERWTLAELLRKPQAHSIFETAMAARLADDRFRRALIRLKVREALDLEVEITERERSC